MKQVLLNLFKNSLEAMPEGGQIIIETAILFAGERKNFCIYFKDTGVGIPRIKTCSSLSTQPNRAVRYQV